MVAISIKITGDLDKLVEQFGQRRLDDAIEYGLTAATVITETKVKEKLEKTVKTGGLRASIRTIKPQRKVAVVEASRVGGSRVYYAKFHEEGTGIYGKSGRPIVPVNAKNMAWFPVSATGTPIAGKRVVRRSVRGQRPVRFMERTARNDRPIISRAFEEAFRRRLGL